MAENDKEGVVSGSQAEKSTKRRFIGFSERQRIIREERANRTKPQPWIVQKLIVGLVIAIVAYAWYVYIGRFCVPMIRKDPDALGGRGLGSESQIVFHREHADKLIDNAHPQLPSRLSSAYLALCSGGHISNF